MAGDWIKVEKASVEKPEVTRAAEMLGVSRREALGTFIDFWVWLDDNLSGSCPDFVRNVSRKSLDEFLHCPGFSATLESIGWGRFDDAAWILYISNADRHNGNPAKSRALDNKRKADTRREMSGSEPDRNRTREEKRREELTTKSKERAVATAPTPHSVVNVSGTRLDPLWTLPIDWLEWTKAERPDFNTADVERIALVFRDHWHSKAGKEGRKQEWFATWRNWIRREQRHYSTRPETLAEKRVRNMDILTGKVRDERVVQGTTERMDRPPLLAIPGGLREPDGFDVEGRGPDRSASGMGG